MSQISARTDNLGHAPTPTDTTTFARILEQSSLGSDEAKQTRLAGARTLAGFNSNGAPWLAYTPQQEDVAALQRDAATAFDSENQAIASQAVASELWWRAAFTRCPDGATATRLAAVLEQRRQIDEAIRWYVRAVSLGDYVAAARLAVMCDHTGYLDLAHLLVVIGRSLLTRGQQKHSNDLIRSLATIRGVEPRLRLISSYEDTDLLYYTACRILLSDDRDIAAECLSAALLRGHKVAALTQGSLAMQAAATNTSEPIGAHSLARRLLAAVNTVPRDAILTDDHSTTVTKTGNDIDALVSAAIDGDGSAIERLLRSILPLVVRYCRARVGRQESSYTSADDVAQEVCLAVMTALPYYRDQGRPFLAFVYGIAAHKVADAHRSAARNRSEPVPELTDEPELQNGPEQQVLNGERSERMARLLGILPPKQREILVLRVVVGLSAEETADAVESTPGAIRVAQQRALIRLRKAMAAEEII
jgi:RNA polymerase sigma-70 factor (ECF subfamily)